MLMESHSIKEPFVESEIRIWDRVGSIIRKINMIHDAISELHEQIEIILKPEDVKKNSGVVGVERPFTCLFDQTLQSAETRALNAVNRLESIVSRLML